MVDISKGGSEFAVSPLAAGISVASIIVALLSYFLASETYRSISAYAAYLFLISAISILILQTGVTNSPFLALWMIAIIFGGIFGARTLGIFLVLVNGYLALLLTEDGLTRDIILGIVLAGELPILISYILWHGKSNSEKTKERAYYDLANELNQVANKAEVVISAISDGVIAVNNQCTIELINPAAQRIVGWGHQDALNLDYKSVLQLLTSDGHELDKSTDPVFDVLSSNQPKRRSDLQLQTNSGKKIAIEVVVSPIGRLGAGAIIVFRDITKEQAEEKAQAEFISTASHEMRTPVASIEGYLGLALNPATATIDAKAHDFITKAHESAQHLGRLFQDLLDVTKADDGRLSNNPKVIDVVVFTNDIIEGLRPRADEKKLRIFFKPTTGEEGGLRTIEPVFFVDLDADHLREVLANLIENAIKYTPAGEVVIDVQGDDNHVVISVTDSGIGIPSEDIPHLFQKFYRVDNSDTREIGGTGLGLYLCRRLIEAMGGRIWVDSEYKKGSTFSVELPRISHEEATRLIEASDAKNIHPSEAKTYIESDDSGNQATPEQRSQALATPIVLNRSVPVSQTSPAAAPVTTNADPLIAASDAPPAVPVAPAAPRPPQTSMVLPPSMQDIESTLQKAVPQAPPQTPPAASSTERPIAVPKRP